MRIAFMGTPDFAVPALRALAAAGHDVAAVYSQPPRPAGRGQSEKRSEVHEAALALNIPVRTPVSLKTPEAQAEFAALGLDLAVVVAYGLILPKAILAAPKHGCFNIHGSLLPRWRGAAPIQRAILAGDQETGITIMQMDEGLDTGPMLLRDSVPITSGSTAETLHDALAEMGARLIVQALADLTAGKLTPTPQPAEGATYAKKLSRDDGVIDWRRPAAEIERQARALTPWPGAFFSHDGKRIKLLAASARAASSQKAPGTVLDDKLSIACGSGVLTLTRLQREGRAALEADAFLRGYALPAGTQLDLPQETPASAP
ncbi:MAG TPA: methionyl-tRNA formyltransferase [Alphaproteobacteria bacterium]